MAHDPLRFELKRLKKEMIKGSLTAEYVTEFHDWYLQHRLPLLRREKAPRKTWKERIACVRRRSLQAILLMIVLVIVVSALGALYANDWSALRVLEEIELQECWMELPPVAEEFVRPLTDCNSMCSGLKQIPIHETISQEQFLRQYAYSGRPVLVRGATANWSALQVFSYQFFKKVFTSSDEVINGNADQCQFFPYNTEFATLSEALNMSDARANFEPGEKNWYIGWSNCHSGLSNQLREHYTRPYFLPNDSESSHVDWLFAGGAGPGAHIHLDHVGRPSWQAQIRGSKTWTLYPVPECEAVCPSGINVTMKTGDIIIIDTNQWYHSTRVHKGSISISIGSEYD